MVSGKAVTSVLLVVRSRILGALLAFAIDSSIIFMLANASVSSPDFIIAANGDTFLIRIILISLSAYASVILDDFILPASHLIHANSIHSFIPRFADTSVVLDDLVLSASHFVYTDSVYSFIPRFADTFSILGHFILAAVGAVTINSPVAFKTFTFIVYKLFVELAFGDSFALGPLVRSEVSRQAFTDSTPNDGILFTLLSADVFTVSNVALIAHANMVLIDDFVQAANRFRHADS